MKLCPYPFSRMQTKNDQGQEGNNGGFFPCCPSWFNQSYWNLGFEKNLEDIWNGKAAIELRKKMYEGDFSYCNRHECKIPLMSVDELSNRDVNLIETPISLENIEAIKQKNPVMPNQPSSLHLVADMRCNLKCPTCRPEVISNNTLSVEADEEYTLVHNLKEHVEIVKMSSGGEVFYSQTQRKLLKSFNSIDFPKLRRIHIVSNGTLFNQKTYDDLYPGTGFIKDISISLDAGSKEVYEKIRGPYWDQVVSNLEWLGWMRKVGKFELLTLNFTLIRDNYRDIPNLVALGKKYHVDRILIQKYVFAFNQGYKTLEEQQAQAIHDPSHPEHEHMLKTLDMFKDEPLVHALLKLDGFEQKIEDHQQIRRTIHEMNKIIPMIKEEKYLEGLIHFFKVFGKSSLDDNYLRVQEENFEKGHIDLKSINEIDVGDENRFKDLYTNLILDLTSTIYNFQKEKKHLAVINSFVILTHLTKNPSAEILSAVANCLRELSRFHESIEYVQKALEVGKGTLSEAHLSNLHLDLFTLNKQLAFSYSKKTEYGQAIHYFNLAKKYEPQENEGEIEKYLLEINYYYYRDMGFSYQRKGLYSLAVVALNKALEHGEGDPDLFFSMGISFKRQLKYTDAKTFLTRALDERPEHYYALMEYGVIELLEGNRKAALELFLQAQSIEPEGRRVFGEKMIKVASRKIVFGKLR